MQRLTFRSLLGGVCGLAFLLSAGSLLAQTVPAGKPKQDKQETQAVPDDPSVTTAVFGDWVLRCVKAAATPAASECEVAQSIMVQGQQLPVAQIAVGRVKAGAELTVTVLLPNNVTIPVAPRLMADDTDKEAVGLAWQRCVPAGCFATAVAGDTMVDLWKKAPGPGKLTFVEGGGQALALTFSLRGFRQAMDALDQARK